MAARIYGHIRNVSIILLLATGLGSFSEQLSAARDHAANDQIRKSEVKYYAENGSYFQLIDNLTRHNGFPWRLAARLSSQMTYKGRRGRLAIIDSPELQAWIIQNFNLSGRGYEGSAFIGLRYICNTRKLIWVNGDELSRTAFSFWDIPWYREDGIRCGINKMPYMGVYISGETNRWRATGYGKAFPHYLVEYPPR